MTWLWMMFFIFLATDLISVLAVKVTYGKKERYNRGMILGVHVPEEAKDEDTDAVRKLPAPGKSLSVAQSGCGMRGLFSLLCQYHDVSADLVPLVRGISLRYLLFHHTLSPGNVPDQAEKGMDPA